jgi:hypothetical protein
MAPAARALRAVEEERAAWATMEAKSRRASRVKEKKED